MGPRPRCFHISKLGATPSPHWPTTMPELESLWQHFVIHILHMQLLPSPPSSFWCNTYWQIQDLHTSARICLESFEDPTAAFILHGISDHLKRNSNKMYDTSSPPCFSLSPWKLQLISSSSACHPPTAAANHQSHVQSLLTAKGQETRAPCPKENRLQKWLVVEHRHPQESTLEQNGVAMHRGIVATAQEPPHQHSLAAGPAAQKGH